MLTIEEIRKKQENPEQLKKFKVAVWIISAAVLGLVMLMREVKIPLPAGVNLAFLPSFHALLNTLAAVSLVLALISIKKGKVLVHQRWIYCADMFFYFFIILCCLSFYHSRDKIWRPKWRWRAFTIRNIRGWFCTECVFVHSYKSHCIGSHQFTFYSADILLWVHPSL